MMVFALNYETVDLEQTNLLPTPAFREPEFEERLREQVDVDKLIEADQQALKDQANARIPFEPKNLMEKD